MHGSDSPTSAKDSSIVIPPSRLSRRRVIQTGAAATGALAMPYVFSRRAAAAKTLSFWQFYSPGGQVKSQDDWFQTTIKAWNDQSDVKIELTYVPNADYVSGSKLQTAFASGQGPDIFLVSPGDFLRYANGGVLTDLTLYMDQAARDDYYEGVIASRMVDGKVYGIPMEVEPMAMYYSADAWDAAKLTDADVPKTWEQLLDVAKKLTTGDRFGVLFETTPCYYQNFTWYPFMWEGGGEMVNADGKTSGMRSDGAVQALKLWQDAVTKGVAPREVLGGGGFNVAANLASGYCAMQNLGIWGISDLKANAPDFKYGVFPLPLPPNGKPSTDLGGWAFVANAKGADPESAAKFCVSALGSTSADSVKRNVEWCTVAKSDMPPRKAVLRDPSVQEAFSQGPFKVFAEQILPTGRAEPRVPPEVYKAVSDAIQAAQLKGTDPKQAGETAATQIEAFLATYQGVPIL
ncbi:MAG: ABC transporter substrate-binding protein [Thermomicrobiales bacterium]